MFTKHNSDKSSQRFLTILFLLIFGTFVLGTHAVKLVLVC